MTVRRGKVHDRSDDPTIPHGTPGGYKNHRCNCVNCRRAAAEQQERYRNAHPERDPQTGRLWGEGPRRRGRRRRRISDEMIERAGRALCALDDEYEQRAYEADRAAFRLGRPKPLPYEDFEDEYNEKARAALEAALNPKSDEGEE